MKLIIKMKKKSLIFFMILALILLVVMPVGVFGGDFETKLRSKCGIANFNPSEYNKELPESFIIEEIQARCNLLETVDPINVYGLDYDEIERINSYNSKNRDKKDILRSGTVRKTRIKQIESILRDNYAHMFDITLGKIIEGEGPEDLRWLDPGFCCLKESTTKFNDNLYVLVDGFGNLLQNYWIISIEYIYSLDDYSCASKINLNIPGILESKSKYEVYQGILKVELELETEETVINLDDFHSSSFQSPDKFYNYENPCLRLSMKNPSVKIKYGSFEFKPTHINDEFSLSYDKGKGKCVKLYEGENSLDIFSGDEKITVFSNKNSPIFIGSKNEGELEDLKLLKNYIYLPEDGMSYIEFGGKGLFQLPNSPFVLGKETNPEIIEFNGCSGYLAMEYSSKQQVGSLKISDISFIGDSSSILKIERPDGSRQEIKFGEEGRKIIAFLSKGGSEIGSSDFGGDYLTYDIHPKITNEGYVYKLSYEDHAYLITKKGKKYDPYR